jgi:hypothetical protein
MEKQEEGIDPILHYQHDVMNLVLLPFICAVATYYVVYNQSEEMFWINFLLFLSYLFIDSLWVFIFPKCVVSPTTILGHHIVSILGWCLPIYGGHHLRIWCAAGVLVEYNTWCLIARRNFRSFSWILSPCFYITWIGFRLIFFPYSGWYFFQYLSATYFAPSASSIGIKKPWFGDSMYFGLYCLLMSLNIQWTYNLIAKNWPWSATRKHQRAPLKGL